MAPVSSATPAGRVPLTRARVLKAALDYVDEHGLESLSIRRLAAELGVRGMSLYTHVNGKDALLDGLVEAMTAELEPPSAAAEADWRTALREFAAAERDMIHRHPSAGPLLTSRHIQPAGKLEAVDSYLQVLARAGFGEERALEVVRVVQVYAEGHALAEVSWGLYGKDPVVPGDEVARMRWVAGMVPRDAPDRLVRVALRYCADCDMNRQFEVGLDLIIRGLEAECPGAAGAAAR
jgi:AcrR family transcriptional regulator